MSDNLFENGQRGMSAAVPQTAQPVKNEMQEKPKSKPASVKRSKIGSKNDAILEFMKSCQGGQFDAIRVMIAVVDYIVSRFEGNVSQLDITQVDLQGYDTSEVQYVHAFLNNGYFREDGAEFKKLLAHRVKQSNVLLKSVCRFLPKEFHAVASTALFAISSDTENIDSARRSLPSREGSHVSSNQNVQ